MLRKSATAETGWALEICCGEMSVIQVAITENNQTRET